MKRDVKIAVAVKDLLSANLTGLSIDSWKVGFLVFRKIPEYGSSEVFIINMKHIEVEHLMLVEK